VYLIFETEVFNKIYCLAQFRAQTELDVIVAACRDPTTWHLDRQNPFWTGRNITGQVKQSKKGLPRS